MRRYLVFAVLLILGLPSMASAESLVPNDPFYQDQWYLKKIGMEQVWGLSSVASGQTVIIAVIDTRVDIDHKDLKDAIWTNDDEIPGNGFDDDQNGYVDDVHGWNFVAKSNDVSALMTSSTAWDAYVHGTVISSLIAARGNNKTGMAGVAWNVKIMTLVGLDDEGNGMTDRVAEAIDYAVANGAVIINMSVEGETLDPALDKAISNAKKKGVLTIVAAGNSNVNGGRDLDTDPVYPTCSSLDADVGLIAVGAVDQNDVRASFSDYGRCVSISAPGVDILGAEPKSTYSEGWVGTSLAAPLVSGAAGLLKSVHPLWTPDQIKNRLLTTATSIDSLQSMIYQGKIGSGRLNVANALAGSEPVSSFEVRATVQNRPTSVFIIATSTQNVLFPFGSEDTRGANVSISDINDDGQPEIAVVPASGEEADLVIYQSNGDEVTRMTLPGTLVDGALITAVEGGFVIADANGGTAWGVDADLTVRTFYPYEVHYRNGLDLMTIQNQAAFAPRNGGGRLVISDVNGTQIVSAFPFGLEPSGRWSLAKTTSAEGSFVVFSGPIGNKRIGVEAIGQLGWQQVSFETLSLSHITLSSGLRTEDPTIQSYGKWNE
jgi:hypothetical protein